MPNTHTKSTHQKMRTAGIHVVAEGLSTYILETLCGYALDDPSKPINIIFRSPGGDVFEALATADAINAAREILDPGVPIVGTVHGHAESAGSLLLQFCDVRKITNHSYIMVHGMSQNIFGADEARQEANRELMQSLRDTFIQAYSSRSTVPLGTWRRYMKSSLPRYYTARQALEAGLVDEVVDNIPSFFKHVSNTSELEVDEDE